MAEVMEDVLQLVREERARQSELYGDNADLEDGTGEGWLTPWTWEEAPLIEQMLREDYERYDKPNWVRLLREEVAEAFCETDPDKLVEELVQVAALAVSWCEKIKTREYVDV